MDEVASTGRQPGGELDQGNPPRRRDPGRQRGRQVHRADGAAAVCLDYLAFAFFLTLALTTGRAGRAARMGLRAADLFAFSAGRAGFIAGLPLAALFFVAAALARAAFCPAAAFAWTGSGFL